MNMVHLKINGIDAEVPAGSTILEAAKSVQIEIPSLCYLKDINCIGACRVCVVEVKGHKGLVASCVYPVEEGMEVFTNTPKVRTSRKTTIELILSSHRKRCLSCVRGNHCELQKLAFDYEVDEERFKGDDRAYPVDDKSAYIVRDNSKCIQCMRCVAACKKLQAVSVIGAIQRGYQVHVGCAFEKSLADSPCVGCGNELAARGLKKDVATVVTQVLVDENDPAFQNPTKPIGAFYDKATAEKIAAEKGYTMVEDAGRGYRQVVPSPKPVDVIEKNVVNDLIGAGVVVITVGGGGIPVIRKDGKLYGTPAVIDKDFASAKLAELVKADATLCLPIEGQSGLFACPIQLESRANEDPCRIVLDALLAYSGGNGYYNPLPAGLIIRAFSRENGVCYIDFSADPLGDCQDPAQMRQCVQAIVLSLRESVTSCLVQITVNGIPLQQLHALYTEHSRYYVPELSQLYR